MIDELIEARIREINDGLHLLREVTARDFKELTVHERLSTRYLVIQLVEAAASICMRILLTTYNETVEGFPECFMRLALKGVLPENLSSRLASASRLRNLLVHRYWEINDMKVYESVRKGLNDFEGFITHVRSFLRDRVKA